MGIGLKTYLTVGGAVAGAVVGYFAGGQVYAGAMMGAYVGAMIGGLIQQGPSTPKEGYTFGELQNTVSRDAVVPIIYGQVRYAGNIFYRDMEVNLDSIELKDLKRDRRAFLQVACQYNDVGLRAMAYELSNTTEQNQLLHIGMALCEGEIEGVVDLFLGDSRWQDYAGIKTSPTTGYDVMRGTADQSPNTRFNLNAQTLSINQPVPYSEFIVHEAWRPDPYGGVVYPSTGYSPAPDGLTLSGQDTADCAYWWPEWFAIRGLTLETAEDTTAVVLSLYFPEGLYRISENNGDMCKWHFSFTVYYRKKMPVGEELPWEACMGWRTDNPADSDVGKDYTGQYDADASKKYGWEPWAENVDKHSITDPLRWKYAIAASISTKNMSAFHQKWYFSFADQDLPPDQYEIKIVNLNLMKSASYYKDACQLEYMTCYTSRQNLAYPHTAYVAATFQAKEKFSGSLPTISAEVKGIKVKEIKSDGTLGNIRYSDSPPECLLDFLTNKRYGLGYDAAEFDIQSFYVSKQWCIDNGFSLNICFNQQTEATEIITKILAVFNGFLIVTEELVQLKIDTLETTVTQAFDADTIIADNGKSTFKSWVESGKSVFNRVVAQYLNKEEDYHRDTIILDDDELISDFGGIIEYTCNIEGITNQTQAQKVANHVLNMMHYTRYWCEFRAFGSAIKCQVGNVITVTEAITGWVAEKFRIVKMTDMFNDEILLTCRQYNPDVYTYDKISSYVAPKTALTDPATPPGHVTNLLAQNVSSNPGDIWVSFLPPVPSKLKGKFTAAKIFVSEENSSGYTERAQSSDGSAVTISLGADAVGRTYRVKVQSISFWGVPADFENAPTVEITVTTPSDAPPPDVTGLEIFDCGLGTEFYGKDCKFRWNSVARYSGIDQLGSNPLGSSWPDKDFKDYLVQIFVDSVQVGSDHRVSDEVFIYTYEMNVEDNNKIAKNRFTIKVWVEDIHSRQSTNAAVLTVENSPPQKPLFLASGLITMFNSVKAFWLPNPEPDIAGYNVYKSENPGVFPGELYQFITSNEITISGLEGGRTYYISVSAVDSFGNESDYAGPHAAVPATPVQEALDKLSEICTINYIRRSDFYFESLEGNECVPVSAESFSDHFISFWATITIEATGGKDNGSVCKIVSTASYGGIYTKRFLPVVPGQNYVFTAFVRSASGNHNINMGLMTYDSSFVRTGAEPWLTGVTDPPAQDNQRVGPSWIRKVVYYTCPPGIKYVLPRVDNGEGAGVYVLYTDRWQFQDGAAPTQWMPFADEFFADPQFRISGVEFAGDTILAGKMAANSILARHIRACAIGADHLDAGIIDVTKINVESQIIVQSNQLANSVITPGKISVSLLDNQLRNSNFANLFWDYSNRDTGKLQGWKAPGWVFYTVDSNWGIDPYRLNPVFPSMTGAGMRLMCAYSSYSVSITSEMVPLMWSQGSPSVTLSCYYQLAGGPAYNAQISILFYNSGGGYLGRRDITLPYTGAGTGSFPKMAIPVNVYTDFNQARSFKIEITIPYGTSYPSFVIDGISVVNSPTAPETWYQEGATEIDGGCITTGVIRSKDTKTRFDLVNQRIEMIDEVNNWRLHLGKWVPDASYRLRIAQKGHHVEEADKYQIFDSNFNLFKIMPASQGGTGQVDIVVTGTSGSAARYFTPALAKAPMVFWSFQVLGGALIIPMYPGGYPWGSMTFNIYSLATHLSFQLNYASPGTYRIRYYAVLETAEMTD